MHVCFWALKADRQSKKRPLFAIFYGSRYSACHWTAVAFCPSPPGTHSHFCQQHRPALALYTRQAQDGRSASIKQYFLAVTWQGMILCDIVSFRRGIQAMAKILTLEEAAEMLSFTPTHTRKLLREGRIPGVKIGREWRINEDELLNLTRKNPRPAQTEKSE
jgi:excisionase family DNA binding protein